MGFKFTSTRCSREDCGSRSSDTPFLILEMGTEARQGSKRVLWGGRFDMVSPCVGENLAQGVDTK